MADRIYVADKETLDSVLTNVTQIKDGQSTDRTSLGNVLTEVTQIKNNQKAPMTLNHTSVTLPTSGTATIPRSAILSDSCLYISPGNFAGYIGSSSGWLLGGTAFAQITNVTSTSYTVQNRVGNIYTLYYSYWE